MSMTSRRLFLAAAAASFGAHPASAQPAHTGFGPVRPPLPVPAIPVVRHDGVSCTLADLLNQRVTAVQLVFTSCRATCPIQGAIFSRTQKLIPDQSSRDILLLTLSVDPEHDVPKALAAWLKTFRAGHNWIAAAPALGALERMRAFFGPGSGPDDNHSTQVSVVDQKQQLIWRTPELPSAEDLADLLRKVASR
jgi:protein SCO1/2